MPFNTSTFYNYFISILSRIIVTLPVLLIALPIHECAHGYVAYLLGDDTAKKSGRLTLNPIRHLDLIGSIGILFLGFGWAKPVPVNPYNFKHHKADMALTALAGPISNLLMAFLTLVVLALLKTEIVYNSFLFNIIVSFAMINIMLCIFNLIPVPPLDGSRLLAIVLPENMLASFERLGVIPVLLLAFVLWRYISTPITNLAYAIFYAFGSFLHL